MAGAIVVGVLPSLSSMPARAANGDRIGGVTFSQDCTTGLGVGIAFDGANLWYSCYRQQTDLYRADPHTGRVTASYNISSGLGALAYDATRNAIWAGWGGPNTGKVFLIQLDSGKNVTGSSFKFSAPDAVVCGLDDGLAYDGGTDTLYISDDCSTVIHHYDTSGNHLHDGPNGTGDFSWAGKGCYNSGLAIGDQLLFQGSDGCSHVWVVNKADPSKVVFDFSTAVMGDPNFRDEGLACDPLTFAAQGKQVMWSKEAYSPMRANAFEIPPGSCGVGGKPVVSDAIRDAVFVHGWHSNANEVQLGTAYKPLMKALLNKLPNHVKALTFYQDLAYASASGCDPTMPTPDANTQQLFVVPNAANPNVCDSESDLGYNAAFLDDLIQTDAGPVAVISNSLGGGIVRGWMALAQQRPNDPTLNLVTTVIFTQGTQQGVFWTNLDQQSKESFGAPGQAIFRWAAGAIGYEVTKPAARDVVPQGPWYQSVNPVPVPTQLHYYNFYSDIKVHYVQYFFIWKTADLGTEDYGDTALLPGDPDPSKMPKDGGSRFLPGLKSTADRHEFAYLHTYDAVVTSDGDGTAGSSMAAQAFVAVTTDPANHPKYIDDSANRSFTVDSCNGQGQVTPVAKILYILDHPSAGCSP